MGEVELRMGREELGRGQGVGAEQERREWLGRGDLEFREERAKTGDERWERN